MKDLIIRNATHKDIQGMLPLLEQLFAIEADFTFHPETQARGMALMLDGCGKHRAVKLALAQDRIIGMCTAQTRISTARGGICATLEDLVVDRAFRGQGVAPQLLEAIEKWAHLRGVAALSLLADKNNTPGLALYKNQGWAATDLIGLVKSLQPE